MGFLIKTRLISKPGQKGTKKLTAEYGDRPVCVRCRYDETRKRRYNTVELIAEEKTGPPERVNPCFVPPYTIVGVRADLHETGLREKVKKAGGIRN